MEQAKYFSTIRNLPDDMRVKIRYFYNNLRMRFADFNDKYRIVQSLPEALQGEISLMFNSNLI